MSKPDLAKVEEIGWLVMAVTTILISYAGVRKLIDLTDPVAATVFVIAMLLVVYFEKKWVSSFMNGRKQQSSQD
jgi:uncharacterized membrane protein YkvI